MVLVWDSVSQEGYDSGGHHGFGVSAVHHGFGVGSLQSDPRTAALYHYLVFLEMILEPGVNATPIIETLARCASGDHADAVPSSCRVLGKA